MYQEDVVMFIDDQRLIACRIARLGEISHVTFGVPRQLGEPQACQISCPRYHSANPGLRGFLQPGTNRLCHHGD